MLRVGNALLGNTLMELCWERTLDSGLANIHPLLDKT